MSVHLSTDGTIVLEGDCSIDDAERLLQNLIANPASVVDWADCIAAHTSVVQILFAAKPTVWGPPSSDFLRTHVEPLVTGSPDGSPADTPASRARQTAQGAPG